MQAAAGKLSVPSLDWLVLRRICRGWAAAQAVPSIALMAWPCCRRCQATIGGAQRAPPEMHEQKSMRAWLRLLHHQLGQMPLPIQVLVGPSLRCLLRRRLRQRAELWQLPQLLSQRGRMAEAPVDLAPVDLHRRAAAAVALRAGPAVARLAAVELGQLPGRLSLAARAPLPACQAQGLDLAAFLLRATQWRRTAAAAEHHPPRVCRLLLALLLLLLPALALALVTVSGRRSETAMGGC